jgi:hypothetical protein
MTERDAASATRDEPINDAADAAEAPSTRSSADADAKPGKAAGSPSSVDYSVAFSPRQVAVGFAIVAGLVALAVTRRRQRNRPDA